MCSVHCYPNVFYALLCKCVLCNVTNVIDLNFHLMQMLRFMLKRKCNLDIIFGSRILYLLILRSVLKISSVINQVKFLCTRLCYVISVSKRFARRSQWPRGLRRRSAAARLLRLWVRNPPGAWTSVVSVVCCEVEVSATS